MENKNVEILLVEDNPHEAMLTIASLREHNLADNLHHVDDGAEALDFIFAKGAYEYRKGWKQPKIILLDLNLPKIGGLEVLRQIKADDSTKSIPVVILSSSQQRSDIKQGYENGVNSYVVKPVEFDEFAKAVSDLGQYWRALNEEPHV